MPGTGKQLKDYKKHWRDFQAKGGKAEWVAGKAHGVEALQGSQQPAAEEDLRGRTAAFRSSCRTWGTPRSPSSRSRAGGGAESSSASSGRSRPAAPGVRGGGAWPCLAGVGGGRAAAGEPAAGRGGGRDAGGAGAGLDGAAGRVGPAGPRGTWTRRTSRWPSSGSSWRCCWGASSSCSARRSSGAGGGWSSGASTCGAPW